jgi:hypothetical protein
MRMFERNLKLSSLFYFTVHFLFLCQKMTKKESRKNAEVFLLASSDLSPPPRLSRTLGLWHTSKDTL